MSESVTAPDSQMAPARTPRRRLRIVLLTIVILLLSWLGLLVRDGLALRTGWLALQSELAALSESGFDLSALQTHLASLQANLVGLRSHAGPLLGLAPALGWLPGIGGEVESAPALLDMAIELLEGGNRVMVVFGPPRPPGAKDDRSSLEQLARALDASHADLLAVQSHIERAGEIRRRIDATRLSDTFRTLLDRFDEFYPALRAGASLLPLAPRLLGVDRPRSYLILIQNEDELRPTGGFISAAGHVTLDAGRIVTMTVADAYQIDDFTKPYGDPPAPLSKYMGLELWVFRDSNWSPDFPTSARKAIELYTYTQGGEIDGVIGLNQRAVQALVAGLGPIRIAPDGPPLTSENIRAYMQAAWAPSDQADSAIWRQERKDFIAKLAQAAVEKTLNGSGQVDWPTMGRELLDVLKSRDLLIYLSDATGSEALATAGWDGAIRRTDGDFLMVVDANVGYNKANALLQESLYYTVTLSTDRPPSADVSITYQHTGTSADGCVQDVPRYDLDVTYEALIQGCYWNYRRVLAPVGSRLIAATRQPIGAGALITGQGTDGSIHVVSDDRNTIFSSLLLVERGQRLDTNLRYALPASIAATDGDSYAYHLLIQKQPGADSWPVSVTVTWPAVWQLDRAQPSPVSVGGASATFNFDLDVDREVTLVLRLPN